QLALALRAPPRRPRALPAVLGRPDAARSLGHLGVVAVLVGVDDLGDLAARRALEPDRADEAVGAVRPVLGVPEGVAQDAAMLAAAAARQPPDRPRAVVPLDRQFGGRQAESGHARRRGCLE